MIALHAGCTCFASVSPTCSIITLGFKHVTQPLAKSLPISHTCCIGAMPGGGVVVDEDVQKAGCSAALQGYCPCSR